MKTKFRVIVFILVVSLISTLSVSAALPSTGWQTEYAVMNTSLTDGVLTMTAYPASVADATTYPSASFNLPLKHALYYDPAIPAGGIYLGFTAPGLPAGFQGSVVVSASQPVASAVTITNKGSSGTARADYTGISATNLSSTILFPIVKHNFNNQTTTFFVQAASEAAHATITYKMNDGSTKTETADIPANKTYIFDPENAGVAKVNCLPAGQTANTSPCFGSATVTSTTGLIAGVYVETLHTGSPANFASSTSALITSDASTKVLSLGYKKSFNATDGAVSVMNTGAAPAMVGFVGRVSGVQAGSPAALAGVDVGDEYTGQVEIEAGKTRVFSAFVPELSAVLKGTWLSFTFTSLATGSYTPQPLIGITTETRTKATMPGSTLRQSTLAFADGAALTNKLACPILREVTSDGFAGSVAIMNAGTVPTTIHFEYVEYGGNVYHFWTQTAITPGNSIGTNRVSSNYSTKFTNDGSWSFPSLAGKKFSVYVWSDPAVTIVGTAPQDALTFNRDATSYECAKVTQ